MSVARNEVIALRDALPGDKNFVYASFLRGLYYGDSWFKEIPKNIFMENYHRVLDVLMTLPGLKVTVACLKDDPEVILGYSIHKGTKLHWVFVKANWRNIGIAKSLVPANIDTVTHLTKVGLSIVRKRKNLSFNPFDLR